MITFLQIQNLALIEDLQLDLAPGFAAITGETGAGKSILIGALALLAGKRVDKSVIRPNADSCHVQASLSISPTSPLHNALSTLNLPPCEDNALILSRTLHRSKNPKILINNALAPLSALASLSAHWIDFHGPHEPQKLFDPAFQLATLDAFAGQLPLLKDYSDLFADWKALNSQIHNLLHQDQLSDDETIFYQTQIDKINAVDPSPDSVADLESAYSRIAKLQDLQETLALIDNELSGDNGLTSAFNPLVQAAQTLHNLDPSTQNLADRTQSLAIELADLADEFNNYQSTLELDPQSIDETTQLMNQWLDIKRQFGPSVEQVLAKRDALTQKIASQSDIEAQRVRLQHDADKLEKQLRSIATQLHNNRNNAAQKLAKTAIKHFKQLGLAKAKFQIALVPSDALGPTGVDAIEFQFTANPGQPLQALSKVASSGETARVMLAMKSALAKVDATPVLVFDEIDANVGGEVGAQVGTALKQLSAEHQLFCVTHLPQVAAQAESHFLVSKTQADDFTIANIDLLSDPSHRTQELARMIGDAESASAQAHAQSLLAQS